MVAILQPLLTRKAADLMSQAVLLIPREMSLPGAAHLLAQARVSGAPVVDDEGRCIGVVSTTDFLHVVESGKTPTHAHAGAKSVYSWQIVDSECQAQETVEDYMNWDPVTVRPGARIGEIARMMIDAHIHRVIVVDDTNHPIGIVSSTDILGAVAQADARL
jgi:predicted transcriptional regulator